MCTCPSCKATNYPPRVFADWPKGTRAPSTVYGRDKVPADKAYKAHWAHCGAEAHRTRAKLDMRMKLPPAGVPHSDPRGWYSFPGGQIGKCRRVNYNTYTAADLSPRDYRPVPATDDVREYVRLFCEANKLTQEPAP